MRKTDFLIFFLFILLSLGAGIFGTVFTIPALSGWYVSLVKPSFNPPGWIFGPVWTTLYIMMGISAFLVWKNGRSFRETIFALTLFFLQLGLNAFWSYVFFGEQSLFWALVVIIMLWFTILATILSFVKTSKVAAVLLIPYLLWVSFASVLNYYIYKLNP